MQPTVDLVLAVKSLDKAKSRLIGAADDGIGDRHAHRALALAIATDTVEVAATHARKVLVVSTDPQVRRAVSALGVPVIDDPPSGGLNGALQHGFDHLRAADSASVIGALQADLPALRGDELRSACAQASGRRAYCADRQGTGTVLLLSAAGAPLSPCFGLHSARAHADSSALAITGELPGLRCDVDTAEDLFRTMKIGLGSRTRALMQQQ